MPTARDEDFKFTDLKPIIQSDVQTAADVTLRQEDLGQELSLTSGDENRIVIVDGRVQWNVSRLSGELKEVVSDANKISSATNLGTDSLSRGNLFTTLNGALFTNALGIGVPQDTKIKQPLHLVYVSSGGDQRLSVSAPRLYIKCESGSRIEIVEEFVSLDTASSSHFSLPVCEIYLDKGAELVHQYAQLDGPSAFHMKTTLIQQSANSKYSLVETNIGGKLSRHDLDIVQDGDETETEMDHFHLSGNAQLHDLHSKVTLDHVSGFVNQLHKCIVTSPSASGVFDGNVQVNQRAQKTDAGQLSRNLLLAPKATVNVKPNLQIIADDVKCTHGCTVSDLSEEEVFYFRARGIDQDSARRQLVYSFGSEITQKLSSEPLQRRVESAVLNTLSAT